jgi:DtxR family manganese transport transcriptional regulator
MKKECTNAKPFIATRNHHLSELAEDYVEIISELIGLKGEAKIKDIAQYLGVSHVTVIRSMERLKKKGYVIAEPYQSVVLTKEGEKLALRCKKRHLFLLEYLMALGVDEDVAKIDVEGMEHHISQATMDAFQKHMQLLVSQ